MRQGILAICLVWPAFAQMTAVQTQKGLKTVEGLEVTVWASEPAVVNPTNIDIDAKGRIWYLEAVNYRRKLKGLPDLRKEGDRIVILEDTDGDGKADKKKVFLQDPSLRSPLGISVLGSKVIVSQAPDVIVYTRDEDDKIVSREVLLTGWGGVDHDHGLHAVTFGPDGRLYFNSGDQGFDVVDKTGKRFTSSRKGPYYAGTALRMNADGTDFTVLGHNFRNPYELATDSFGSVWQSDNDDDGNAWTRFNFVMPGGNYGYWGPGGRSWREDRGTHFHQENPGVVPNIARLGAGSPCGLVIYEGKLLPARYRGQPIHAEAGKRQLNTYFLSNDGAGYSLRVENTIAGEDTWFRPSDVAVAPDGAVYVADWYDPGVGGHNMGDINRGRIYRLAPKGYKPQTVAVDLNSAAGLTAALASPAQSVRYLAWMRLREQGAAALPVLSAAWKQESDPILHARSLWLLGALGEPGRAAVGEALGDPDERFRILGLRVLQLSFPGEFVAASQSLWRDSSPQVRREIAIQLQYHPIEESRGALTVLAGLYDGKDRWYLEALGIGVAGKEPAMFEALRNIFPDAWDGRLGKLLWRMRLPESMPYLLQTLNRTEASERDRIDAMEAVAAQPQERAMAETARVVGDESAPAALREAALTRLGKRLFSEWSEYRAADPVVSAISKALDTPALQRAALEVADDLEDSRYGPSLLRLARNETIVEELRVAAIQATGKTKVQEYVPALEALSKKGTLPVRLAAIRALGSARPENLESSFQKLLLTKEPNEIRSEALRVLARSDKGVNLILDLEQKQTLPAEMRTLAANLVAQNRTPAIQARAAKILPPPVSRNKTKLPSPRALTGRQGDAASGRKVFALKTGPNCASCHALEEGKPTVGPILAAIGNKLGKEALLDSILNPSAGIAPEYVTWIFDTKSQGQVIGILAEDTPQRVTLKTDTGESVRLKPSEIMGRRKSNLSMMPEDLASKMTEQQIVDLLEFLTTLREDRRAAR